MRNNDPKNFGKVAVLMGGTGSEREISLMSGNAVLEALIAKNVDAHGIDVKEDICQKLLAGHFNRAFIAMHGTLGEDGTIQGFLEYLKIPYTGSNVLSSALAMDKLKTKLIWKGLNIPTAPFMRIQADTPFAEVLQKLGLPLAIKPAREGSSIGITKVSKAEQYQQAVQKALQYDKEIFAETWIEGDEVTIGILKNEPLPVIRIEVPEGLYDYEAKYFSETTQYHIPSGLSADLEIQVQNIALTAYRALGCRHWGRVDGMIDTNGKIWLLEVNTIPGLTSHSLVPKAVQAIGIDFPNLILEILTQTLE